MKQSIVFTDYSPMKMVFRQAMTVAERTDNASVLIMGEAGTGKELLAKEIHNFSRRNKKPFVSINCSALRDTLLESEIFGHEKGSFMGAYSRKIGLVEVAHGGTLVLEEVDALGPGMQAKILRMIQENEVYRIGGKDPIGINVRLICTTSKNLDTQVVQGHFREDLYYRINTIMLRVPTLRERHMDIQALLDHFMASGLKLLAFTNEAKKVLTNYSWPGNVRELKNMYERLTVLIDQDVVNAEDLPDHMRNPNPSPVDSMPYDSGLTLYELEKRYIIRAMEHFDGNKIQAAEALGITIKTLYNKLYEYGELDGKTKS